MSGPHDRAVVMDPLTSMLSSIADRAERAFRDRNLTIRQSKVVHAVSLAPWMAGTRLPAPACHVGVSGWAVEDLHPTDELVTCRRCRHDGSAADAPLAGGAHQLTLPLQIGRREA